MVIDMLVLVFVSAFVALAIYGHVLLLGDFWKIAVSDQPLERNDPNTAAMKVPAE